MTEERHHCDGCEEIDQLRAELESKHRQNRQDIHDFRNQVQTLLLQLADLRGQIVPIVGATGILQQLRSELSDLRNLVTDLRIARGSDTGRREETNWLRDHLGTIIVGLLLVLAGHFWK